MYKILDSQNELNHQKLRAVQHPKKFFVQLSCDKDIDTLGGLWYHQKHLQAEDMTRPLCQDKPFCTPCLQQNPHFPHSEA